MSRLAPRALVAASLLTTVPLVGACKGGGAKTQVKAEYKNTLASVLDMVTETPDGYLAARDLTPALELARLTKTLVDGPVDSLLKVAEKSGERVDRKEFEEFRTRFGQMLGALEGSGIKWDHGFVVSGKKGGEGVLLFQADSLDKLGPILTAADEDPAKVTKHCAKLDADPAWIACGKSAEQAKAFKPAKKGAELVASLEHDLPGVDFKSVNAAMDFDEAAMVLATDPGIYHFAVHPKKDLPPEFAKVSGRGKAKALRLLTPGDTFVWGRVDMGAAKAEAGGVPGPAKAVVDAIDGEFMLAGTSDPGGFLMQVGVTDPYPVRSMLDLGWTQKDKIPKEIPDMPGATIDLSAEEVKVGDETFRVMTARFDSPEMKKFKSTMEPVVSAWVGGGYMSIGGGMGADEAKKVASATGEGPSADLLASLPSGLAKELEAQEVAYAFHATFDGLQSPAVVNELEKHWGDIDIPDKPSFDAVIGVMQLFAPISEFTGWVSRTNTSPVFHVSVRMFGDARSEEGKAALAAIDAVNGGGDRVSAYGDLAKKFGGSHRAHAYEVRATDDLAKASVGAFGIVGVAAAVAIPAFVKYQNQSRAAVRQMDEMNLEMERELRAVEAENAEAIKALDAPTQAPPAGM